VKRDIAYGDNPRQQLDLYVPVDAHRAPVIVFYYGGSWQNGSKDDYRFLGQAFAEKGFITAVADYRLYPQVKFPDFIEDGARAFAYAHAHAAQWGGDPERVYVAGHSAGAYIAMMVGGDPRYLVNVGGKRSDVRGILGIAGPYDFLPFTDDTIKAIFSTATDAATQPINHLTAPMPPVFLATGNADDTVDPRNSQRVEAKLKTMQSDVVAYHYPDTGHIGIILSMAQGFRSRTSLLTDIAHFINDHAHVQRSSKNRE
jgi:acetyl esterase/lipase